MVPRNTKREVGYSTERSQWRFVVRPVISVVNWIDLNHTEFERHHLKEPRLFLNFFWLLFSDELPHGHKIAAIPSSTISSFQAEIRKKDKGWKKIRVTVESIPFNQESITFLENLCYRLLLTSISQNCDNGYLTGRVDSEKTVESANQQWMPNWFYISLLTVDMLVS